MQTQLPRRPYVELPPPPDGLVSARREASRRRTRRAIASVTGGVSAVVLVVAGVLLTGGGGVAVLRPAPVAPATRLPTPGSSVAPSAAAGAHRGGAAVSPVRASARSAIGAAMVGPAQQEWSARWRSSRRARRPRASAGTRARTAQDLRIRSGGRPSHSRRAIGFPVGERRSTTILTAADARGRYGGSPARAGIWHARHR